MRTKEEIAKSIVEWFSENEEVFNDCIEELDSYNGYLDGERWWDMSLVDDLLGHYTPSEILEGSFFGWDEDVYEKDEHGVRRYGKFNPNRAYFQNSYGSLVSSSWKHYADNNDSDAVEEMSKNRKYVPTIDAKGNEELAKLFDEYEDPKAYFLDEHLDSIRQGKE